MQGIVSLFILAAVCCHVSDHSANECALKMRSMSFWSNQNRAIDELLFAHAHLLRSNWFQPHGMVWFSVKHAMETVLRKTGESPVVNCRFVQLPVRSQCCFGIYNELFRYTVRAFNILFILF